MNMSILSIVTTNTKKYTELSHIFAQHGVQCARVSYSLAEPQSLDAQEIVRAKVLEAFAQVRGPVCVDDSGFYIEKYNRFPGTLSKYVFRGIGYDGLFALCGDGDRAHFECTVGYMDESLLEPIVTVGQYPGVITTACERNPQEEMPYAPLFIPDDGCGKPMSTMTALERARDHRHQAVEMCVAELRQRQLLTFSQK